MSASQRPVRDAWRDGSPDGRPCPVCGRPRPSRRAAYCSHACRQRAYRQRRTPLVEPVPPPGVGPGRPRRVWAEHTVYACPSCDERYLGQRRCPECQLFCRRLGPGGACPECDAVILLDDLLGREVAR